VLALNCINDGYELAVNVSDKSESEYTSIYPPICKTEKLVPKTDVLFTLFVPFNWVAVMGFLYGNDILVFYNKYF
jgi:hypothetical protein